MHIALPCILSCHTYDELKSWLLNGHRAKIWVGSVGVGGLLGGERWCGRRWVHCHPPARPPTRETRMKSFNNNNNKTFLRCYSYHNPPTYTRKQILHGTWHSWDTTTTPTTAIATNATPLLLYHYCPNTPQHIQRHDNKDNPTIRTTTLITNICWFAILLLYYHPPARL